MAAPAFPLPYKYQPLSNQDSIRILILYPADDPTEPLRGQLEYTERAQILRSLSNFNTQYETVSYAWGDQKPTESILLEKDASELKITKNVDCMLRHLRKRSVKRSLWIDALCLNQDDKTEKSIQVPLMGKIYAQAKKTNIWLGNSDEETPRIWAFLRRLAALEKDQINEALLKSELQHIWGEEDGVSPTERFLCRPWFSRRWILQEVFLSQAAVVRCGNMKISWNWIASGLETLRTASERTLIRLGPSAQNTLNTAHVLRNNTGKILDLIWDFDTAKCADPRDKIFALCGLATNLTKESFNAGQETQTDPKLYPISTEKIAIEQMVDYNTGWEDVYRRFAQSCLQAGYGEEIGYHLSAFGSLGRPSWVPNWSNCRRVRAVPRLPLFGGCLIGAQLHLSQSLSALQIIPYNYTDLISEIYPDWSTSIPKILQKNPFRTNPGTVSWAALNICFLVCLGLGLGISGTYKVPDKVRKLVTSKLSEMGHSPDFDLAYSVGAAGKVLHAEVFGYLGDAELYHCYPDLYPDPRAGRKASPKEENEYQNDILEAITNMMEECTLFQSADGSIGLGPKGTKTGDRICGFPTACKYESGYVGGVLHQTGDVQSHRKNRLNDPVRKITVVPREHIINKENGMGFPWPKYRVAGHCIRIKLDFGPPRPPPPFYNEYALIE